MGAVRRPSAVRYWAAGCLVVVGSLAAVAWGLTGYRMLQDRVEALPRTTIPGELALEVAEPGGLTIYYEDPTADGGFVVLADLRDHTRAPVGADDVVVTGPSGVAVPARVYAGDVRFDVGDRVAVAAATVDIPTAGSWTVEVAGEAPPGARIAVGDVIDAGLLANAAGAVGLFVCAIVAATVIIAVGVQGSRGRAAGVRCLPASGTGGPWAGAAGPTAPARSTRTPRR